MRFELAVEKAKRKAKEYADKRCRSTGSPDWCKYYNGFFDGYLDQFGDEETERAIENKTEDLDDAL